MKLLITGGAGFIGSNFIRYILNKYPDYQVVNYDKLTYAGNLDNLKDIENNSHYKFVHGDVADEKSIDQVMKDDIDAVVNFAAETHVDRSIHAGSREFVLTEVLGTQTLLDASKKYGIKKYIQISTDEVYGSLFLNDQNLFTEETPFAPNVPYAACKAGGDMLCRAYNKTYGMNIVVSHCSNNYGPYQYPEKLIPYLVCMALRNEPLPLYGDGLYVRDWLYVEDHCEAIDLILHLGKSGKVYNIGGNNEKSNLEIAKIILRTLDKPEALITFVTDRPGHDRRYGIDSSKLQNELGWKPKYNFDTAIKNTIEWYVNRQDWVEKVRQRCQEFNPHIKINA